MSWKSHLELTEKNSDLTVKGKKIQLQADTNSYESLKRTTFISPKKSTSPAKIGLSRWLVVCSFLKRTTTDCITLYRVGASPCPGAAHIQGPRPVTTFPYSQQLQMESVWHSEPPFPFLATTPLLGPDIATWVHFSPPLAGEFAYFFSYLEMFHVICIMCIMWPSRQLTGCRGLIYHMWRTRIKGWLLETPLLTGLHPPPRGTETTLFVQENGTLLQGE